MSILNPPSRDAAPVGVSRRSACALLAMGATLLGQPAAAAVDADIESALAEKYALMRRAYQTGNVELWRSFYSDDVVLATEGSGPVVGLEAVIAAGRAVLPQRRDITVDLLRVMHSAQGDMASHLAKIVAYPRDATAPPRIGSALLLWRRGAAEWRCHVEMILIQDMESAAGLRQPPT